MTADPKPVKYRNPALLRLADGAPCMLCGRQDGTTVAAHSNWASIGDKGFQTKAHDWAVAFLCHECHRHIDQNSVNTSGLLARCMEWGMASIKTYGWLLENGHLQVKEKP